MSLRERLNAMGIDGFLCERLIKEYYEFTRGFPDSRMGCFLRTVKDTVAL